MSKRYGACSTRAIKKRREVGQVDQHLTRGDMGVDILTPVFNRDIPADCKLVDIICVGDSFSSSTDTPAIMGKQVYGSTMLYQFPELENCPPSSPKARLKTNHIYDVNVECDIKVPADQAQPLSTQPTAATPQAGSGDFLDTTGNKTKWIMEYLTPGENIFKSFILYVVPASRQKDLGDWIQANSSGGKLKINNTDGVTAWQFDDFCHQVRPIYARYCFWHRMAVVNEDYFFMSDKTGNSERMKNPYNSNIIAQGEYRHRDFHLYAGKEHLTPTDYFANKLFIGTLGDRSLATFRFLRLNIFYKEESVCASDLYWQNQNMYLPQSLQGSRREYGIPDWDSSKPSRGPITDQSLLGVTTSSVGNFEPFADGRLNALSAATNVLQDESLGTWY